MPHPSRDPLIDHGLEILEVAIEAMANEGQPVPPMTNGDIARFVRSTTGSTCTEETISYTHRRAISKMRREAELKNL